MISLVELNEKNWIDFAELSVKESQKHFLADNIGIIARGYVYRSSGARVIGIADDELAVGLAMIRDMDEEPACYELQQFMIDRRYQGKGYGTQALKMILSELEKERKYDCVEVCVKMDDVAALHVYKKLGFEDTGYIDEDVPDSFNLMYNFKKNEDKVRISEVEAPVEKQKITRLILEALPEWFGLPDSREEYITESSNRPFFAAYDENKPIGFVYLDETGKDTVELYVMGIIKEYHRQGIGRSLVEKAKELAKRKGYSFMQVKTVQMGKYKEYDKTNCFYLSLGFKEFEVFPTLWDEWNPCQVYVMGL